MRMNIFHRHGFFLSLLLVVIGTGLVLVSQAVKKPTPPAPTPVTYAEKYIVVAIKGEGKEQQIKGLLNATEIESSRITASGISFYKVSIPDTLTADQAVTQAESLPQIVLAEKDPVAFITKTPNDPLFTNGNQWNLTNISAPAAWDVTTGSSSVLIGTIDTGVNYLHRDLVSNIWTNPNEIAGNTIDDDSNGVIDDIHGADYYDLDGDPQDQHGHGTKSAGIIGAHTDNNTDMAGINWNVSIVPCRSGGTSGSIGWWSSAQCIRYLTDLKRRGFNVVASSNSYGGGGGSYHLASAIEEANTAGILVVGAAGNTSSDNDVNPFYPASYDYPNVISVGATGGSNERLSFSSYGKNTVHIGAPGSVETTGSGGGTIGFTGTSASAPHVAGAAGLVAAAKPELNALQIKDRLLSTGFKTDNLTNQWSCGCRLDLAAAVARAGSSGGAGDNEAPSTPSGLQASLQAKSTVQLSWQAATDNVGVTGYNVYRDGIKIANATSTSYLDLGPTIGNRTYEISAYDTAGNESAKSAPVTIEVKDNTAPTAPTNLTATPNETNVALQWSAATDDVGVTSYDIYRTALKIGTVNGSTLNYTDISVPFGTHSYTIKAVDAAGNTSAASNTITITLSDTQAPSAPANLKGTVTNTTIALTWDAATDNVGVKNYQVFRNTTHIATVTTTTYTDASLAVGSYVYSVKATDSAGNLSPNSNQVTLAIGDTQAPTSPGNVQGKVTDAGIEITWDASTDNVAVTAYSVYRDSTKVASVTTRLFNENNLAPATYTYAVSALDAAGNESTKSQSISLTVDARTACFDNLRLNNRAAGKNNHVNLTVSLTTKSGTLIGSTKAQSSENGKVTIKEGYLNALDRNPETVYSVWIKGDDYLATRQDVKNFLATCASLTKPLRLGDLAGNNNKIDLADLIESIKRIQGKSGGGEGFRDSNRIPLSALTGLIKEMKTNPNGDE